MTLPQSTILSTRTAHFARFATVIHLHHARLCANFIIAIRALVDNYAHGHVALLSRPSYSTAQQTAGDANMQPLTHSPNMYPMMPGQFSSSPSRLTIRSLRKVTIPPALWRDHSLPPGSPSTPINNSPWALTSHCRARPRSSPRSLSRPQAGQAFRPEPAGAPWIHLSALRQSPPGIAPVISAYVSVWQTPPGSIDPPATPPPITKKNIYQ